MEEGSDVGRSSVDLGNGQEGRMTPLVYAA